MVKGKVKVSGVRSKSSNGSKGKSGKGKDRTGLDRTGQDRIGGSDHGNHIPQGHQKPFGKLWNLLEEKDLAMRSKGEY